MSDIPSKNLQWKQQFSLSILQDVRSSYSDLVVSSSFGEFSAVMLDLISRALPHIPVVHVKLGAETETTRNHREWLTERLDLNLEIFRESNHGDKKETFNHALREVGARTLISGLMWDETRHREDFDYVMYDEDLGIYRIHPILHWKQRDLRLYVHNQSLPVNSHYRDPHKEESEKKECGIHIFDYQQDGSGI